MNTKNIFCSLGIVIILTIFFIILIPQTEAIINDQPDFRARGYSLTGELKTVFLNNGRISGLENNDPFPTNSPQPEGYYHGLQYIPITSFILGIPGRDPQGNPYPWAMRPMVDSLGNVYPDSIVYWGATVSESWFDRTLGVGLTDWEADSLGHLNLFGGATNQEIPENSGYHWISPDDPFAVLAHSNYPFTWPGGGWPGFWGWDENGQITPGQFFSDEDIYWEMDDRTADRDVDPTQGYPTGIKVKAMASGFEEIPGGIIILRYRLINQSQWDYKDIYAGFYFDADFFHRQGNGSYAGRTNDDDMMRVILSQDLAYIWDNDGSSPVALDLDYAGIGYLETPPASRDIDLNGDGQPDIMTGDPTGATGWHYFDWYFRPGARDQSQSGPFSGDGITPVANDKETIQYKLMAGDTAQTDSDTSDHAFNMMHYFHPDLAGILNPRFDSYTRLIANYPEGLDCVFMLSNGPFNLDSGDSTEVVVALLAGDDSTALALTSNTARSIFENGIRHKDIHLVNGNGGEAFMGNATLTWYVDPGYPHPVDFVDIYLGKGYHPEWRLLASNVQNSGSFTFNALNYPDGAFYRAAIVSNSGPGFVYGVSDTFFVINDPNVNTSPDLAILEPMFGDTLSGITPIRWVAADADFDPLFFSIDVESHGIWKNFYQNQTNTNYAELNTHQLFDGVVSVKVTIDDNFGNTTAKTIDDLFIYNAPTGIPDTVLHHVSGYGNGRVNLSVIDQQALTGHRYRLEFDSVTSGNLSAHIYDIDEGTYLANNIDYEETLASVDFDGLNIKLMGFYPAIIDSTYWKIGNSTWKINPTRIHNNPANYELVFDTAGIDTLYDIVNGNILYPLPFQAFNRTYAPNTPLQMKGWDAPPTGQFDPNDLIFLHDSIVAGHPIDPPASTYRLRFNWDSLSVAPQPGDIFRFTTLGYFWEQDTILFKSPTWVGLDDGELLIYDFALHQNYPNPFNPTTTIEFALPYPTRVKIEIFNILGQRVRTILDAKRGSGKHKMQWDGRNDNGQSVATGVYIYRMKTENDGTGSGQEFIKSRKMLLIR